MNTYETYVRIYPNDMIVKTWVIAEDSQQAYYLLQGQYGNNNVVYFPQQVTG